MNFLEACDLRLAVHEHTGLHVTVIHCINLICSNKKGCCKSGARPFSGDHSGPTCRWALDLLAENKVSLVCGPHDHLVHRVSLCLHPCLWVVHWDANQANFHQFHRPVVLSLAGRPRHSLLFGSRLVVGLSTSLFVSYPDPREWGLGTRLLPSSEIRSHPHGYIPQLLSKSSPDWSKSRNTSHMKHYLNMDLIGQITWSVPPHCTATQIQIIDNYHSTPHYAFLFV